VTPKISSGHSCTAHRLCAVSGCVPWSFA